MPAMPRPKGKGRRIAYSILGVPDNIRNDKDTKKERAINERINAEDTARSR